MGDYRDLNVWQDARKLAVHVYRRTATFAESERFGLVSQMRRASISILSSIAEAHGRGSSRDRIQLLFVARGSTFELQTQSLLSGDLGLLSPAEAGVIVTASINIARQLSALIRQYRMPPPLR